MWAYSLGTIIVCCIMLFLLKKIANGYLQKLFLLFPVEDVNLKHGLSWNEFRCRKDMSALFEATYRVSDPAVTFLVVAGLECIEQLIQKVFVQ